MCTQVQTPLENCENLQLQFVRQISESQAVMWVYNQKNVTWSRKFILPFLGTHFETKARKCDNLMHCCFAFFYGGNCHIACCKALLSCSLGKSGTLTCSTRIRVFCFTLS